ncbi:MAG: hypothetical protein HXY36_05975 [Chloroflexi bacterium]|nr:hypothetical protein [Chloroflexota bacterium]
MRRLRRCGASLAEIAGVFGSNEKTIFYHVRDIEPSRDGHEIELIKEAFWQWLPQFPWEDKGWPLPRWLVRYLREGNGQG